MSRKAITKETKEIFWFGAKTIFLHTGIGVCPGRMFEERVVLIKAHDLDEAIELAKKEARQYAKDFDCSYTGFVSVSFSNGEIGNGKEVYSLMRTSELDEKGYLDYFYDTGAERTQKCEDESDSGR